MKHQLSALKLRSAAFTALVLSLGSLPAWTADTTKSPSTPVGASMLGGALPGGAIISARSVVLEPLAGGSAVATPIAADGKFEFVGMAPGRYRLSLKSVTVPKQTQGATFGEKVSSGVQSAGSAVAQGTDARAHDTAKNAIGNVRRETASPPADAPPAAPDAKLGIDGSMPNRISMNVTTPRQKLALEVDGAPAVTEIGPDGRLAGSVAAP
jgi:hypothetical protein